MSGSMSVRPQKVSSVSVKFDVYVEVDEWCYDPIQGQGQGHEPWQLEILPFSNAISSAIYNGSWQLTTDS